ncbi:valine--tRNA ligase-like isoform X2 [Asterias amurensis]|uniref:valine--tRNA ligase-like isoform X2 n=1 Tax=Asterias amurensis TaxID=7602 RepID=UPI003AB4147C
MFSLYFSQRISSLNCRYVGGRNGIWRARRCRHSAGSAEGDGTGEDNATGAAANHDRHGSDSTTVETADRKKNNTSNKSDRMQSKLEKLRRQQKRQELLRVSKVMKVQSQPARSWKPKEIITYDIPTMPGDKKDTSVPLPKSYSPAYVESAWYAWWENMGFFKPEKADAKNADKKPYVTCLPPPNVTGMLHLGHTLMVAIEDSVVRWNRMQGRPTVWVPGCDHAGIATQIMVEKSLWQSQQKTRHDLGREKFTQEIWKWKEEKGDEIYRQLKRLGASLDWDRAKFTMDESYARAVREAFIRLHDKGTIYRSTQLVNWSCSLKSVISDIEVETKTLNGRSFIPVPEYAEPVEFGTLTLFAYPVHNSDEKITVATTRLETMLGDTALAVHPDDDRYRHLIGQSVDHPFTQKPLPIIADHSVDKDFGTGAVKITPAHDFNDYEMGQRHNLPSIIVIDDTGHMTSACAQFQGLKRFDARKAVSEALAEKGLLVETKDHPMDIPLCRRSKDIVEPMLKTQWFVDTKQMAEDAVIAVESGDLKIIPESHKKTWYNWLNNIRDWCISRQLWWGHQVPVYQITTTNEETNHLVAVRWVAAHSHDEAISKAAKKFDLPAAMIKAEQDPDVLDTWFSSSLFPFAVFGWPDQTSDLQRYYPTTMLETGHDILFFWVARMVMMAKELLGTLPFTEVYLHSMVRDAHGRKMSKSLGNVIDPLNVIHGCSLEDLHKKLMTGVKLDEPELTIALKGQESDYPSGIPECGTDALRFALCQYKAQVEDLNLSIETVLECRHFCNKIWNATKFTLSKLGADYIPLPINESTVALGPMDRWILSRLSSAADVCNTAFEEYQFPTITSAIREFWLNAFCDVYLESVKGVLNSSDPEVVRAAQHTLYHCVHSGLCLLSPFMPYLTEELYQRLPKVKGQDCPSVCLAEYPRKEHYPARDTQLEREVDLVLETLHTMRSLQADYQFKMADAKVQVVSDDVTVQRTLESYSNTLTALSRCPGLALESTAPPPSGWLSTPMNSRGTMYLRIKDSVNVKSAIKKMSTRRKNLRVSLDSLMQTLEGADYTEKTPLRVQEANDRKIDRLRFDLQQVENSLNQLETAS